jgi:hypothetical protein
MVERCLCGAKTIWNKTNPADANNLIDIAARCLLIEEAIN